MNLKVNIALLLTHQLNIHCIICLPFLLLQCVVLMYLEHFGLLCLEFFQFRAVIDDLLDSALSFTLKILYCMCGSGVFSGILEISVI
jgi:uncharacterized membrane protein (Fun14 family)